MSLVDLDKIDANDDRKDRYHTDKCCGFHNYIRLLYAGAFDPIRDRVTHVLELGVREGYSHALWRDFFTLATVYGVDTDISLFKATQDTTRITLIQGNAADRGIVDHFNGVQFDIIIDDASHIVAEQVAAFNNLHKLLKPGGHYYIEDIQPQDLVDATLTPIDELRKALPESIIVHDLRDVHKIPDNVIVEYVHGIQI